MKEYEKILKSESITVEQCKKALKEMGIVIRTDEKEHEFELVDQLGNSITKTPFDYNPENVEIAVRCYYLGILDTICSVVMFEADKLESFGGGVRIYNDIREYAKTRFSPAKPDMIGNSEELYFPDRDQFIPKAGTPNVEEQFNKVGHEISMGRVHLTQQKSQE